MVQLYDFPAADQQTARQTQGRTDMVELDRMMMLEHCPRGQLWNLVRNANGGANPGKPKFLWEAAHIPNRVLWSLFRCRELRQAAHLLRPRPELTLRARAVLKMVVAMALPPKDQNYHQPGTVVDEKYADHVSDTIPKTPAQMATGSAAKPNSGVRRMFVNFDMDPTNSRQSKPPTNTQQGRDVSDGLLT